MSTAGWVARAACRTGNADPELFYVPTRREKPHEREAREQLALSYCDTCPVREECFEAFRDDPWAIAGGTLPEQRQARAPGEKPYWRTCAECGIPMVPGKHEPGPGQREHGGKGMCAYCYHAKRRAS